MKYIIEIEDEPNIDTFDKAKYYKCKQVPYWYVSENIKNKLTPYTEPDRKAIEDGVWGFVRELIHCNNGKGMTGDELQSCFGYELYSRVFKHLTYSKAKARYEAWKKEKDEIRVGDEVEIANTIGVVTRVPEYDEQRVHYITESGTVYCNNAYAEIKKTGRHFDEIEELLKKMRDADED